MPIPVTCTCGKRYQAPDNAVGKYVRCKSCNALVKVPSTNSHARDAEEIVVATPIASSTVRSSSTQPLVAQPVVANPVVANPVVANPVVANPVVANPVVASAVVASAVVANPVVAQPVSQPQPSIFEASPTSYPPPPNASPFDFSSPPAQDPFAFGASPPNYSSNSSYSSSNAANNTGASTYYSAPATGHATSSPSGKSSIPISQWVTGLLIVGGCFLFAAVGSIVLWFRSSSASPTSGMNANGNQINRPGNIPGAGNPAGRNNSNSERLSGRPDLSGRPGRMGVAQRPEFTQTLDNGVVFGQTKGTRNSPGGQTEMNVYLPPGQHGRHSLGCVLVAPAGTNLLMGNSVADGDYHDETLPYAKAGYAVVQYSLDGHADVEQANMPKIQEAYSQYRSSQAGWQNIRAVLDFLDEKMPEVNPKRIFLAGHSSAGTVSLLGAKRESDKIAGCIAYAPCTDPEAFHRDFASDRSAMRIFPGFDSFDRENSPIRNASFITTPLFIFQARDDTVADVSEARRFVDEVKKTNNKVEFFEVASGGHYESMIKKGIPAGIAWLKRIDQGL